MHKGTLCAKQTIFAPAKTICLLVGGSPQTPSKICAQQIFVKPASRSAARPSDAITEQETAAKKEKACVLYSAGHRIE
jgi:hypothetical protein